LLFLLIVTANFVQGVDTSYLTLVELIGRPADLDAAQMTILEDLFISVYNDIEEQAIASGNPTFTRRLVSADIDEDSISGLGGATVTQPFTLLIRTDVTCDTCEPNLRLFSNVTAPL
jgi:hypothetical protein